MAEHTEHHDKSQTDPLSIAFSCLQQLAENNLVAAPIEPTITMVQAAARVCMVDEKTCRCIYEQMLLAADDSLIVYEKDGCKDIDKQNK